MFTFYTFIHIYTKFELPGCSTGKESACNAGHLGSIPGSGRSPGRASVNTLQYSCLENPHGQGSLAPSCSPWGCKESDTTERLTLSLGMRGAIMVRSLDFLLLGTKNPRLVLSLLRVDDLWDLTQVAGGNPRAGNQREVPHRTAEPGQAKNRQRRR